MKHLQALLLRNSNFFFIPNLENYLLIIMKGFDGEMMSLKNKGLPH
jgi:hypothetical protein